MTGRDLVEELTSNARETMQPLGIKLATLHVIEFALTGPIKTAYADLLKANIEGQSAMQRARNEAATMHSLINTAKLVQEHPGLLELRILTSGQRPKVNFYIGQPPVE